MFFLRWMFLVLLTGSLSGGEGATTINTQEEEDYFSEVFIQYLIYYPEENNTTIIYKI